MTCAEESRSAPQESGIWHRRQLEEEASCQRVFPVRKSSKSQLTCVSDLFSDTLAGGNGNDRTEVGVLA